MPLEQNVESMLRADYNVQRVYLHPTGPAVSMYVGYYGTERGGRPEHTPEVCYRSQGWTVAERRVLDVAERDGRTFRVNEYLVEQDGARHLVLFWFRSHRRTGLLGGFDQAVDRLVGRLVDGRADGSLVRVSMPVRPGSEDLARTILRSFAADLDAQLGRHWPLEAAVRRFRSPRDIGRVRKRNLTAGLQPSWTCGHSLGGSRLLAPCRLSC